MWWHRKVKTPEQNEFWGRCDEAAEIRRWSDQMDAYGALMKENPEEYIAWSRDYWKREMKQRGHRRR